MKNRIISLVWKWPMYRWHKAHQYFKNNSVRKLHLGAGQNHMEGWLNSDLIFRPGYIYIDATKHMPFKDDSFYYVFSEHMIEHLTHAKGRAMLAECYRIMKSGGTIRIATPNLTKILSLVSPHKNGMERQYANRLKNIFFPGEHVSDVVMLNYYFRAWDYQFLYDNQTLETTLEQTGFTRIQQFKPLQSRDKNLVNIERHGFVLGEVFNKFETIVVEALKP